MEMARSFTALIVEAPQAPLLWAILHAAEPCAAHPPEPIGTWPPGQLDWQFRAVSVLVILSLIFDSIELDLSMTKTRLKAPAHLGCKGGDGGVGGGEGEGGGGEGEGGGGEGEGGGGTAGGLGGNGGGVDE